MTLGELLESSIKIEGHYRIQCWEDEDSPTIYHDGEYAGDLEEYYERRVAYIFPYMGVDKDTGVDKACFCIELEELQER